jgi:Gamma-glutamylcysteine synthetase
LTRRRKLDRMGGDESHFLNALHRIADSGKTPAQEKLELYHGRWKGGRSGLRRSSRTRHTLSSVIPA